MAPPSPPTDGSTGGSGNGGSDARPPADPRGGGKAEDAHRLPSTGFDLFDLPGGVVGAIVSGVGGQLGQAVKPEAVAAVATTFSFPLVLMVLVVLFLLVQHRLDGRDPKFRSAPLTETDATVPFDDEEDL